MIDYNSRAERERIQRSAFWAWAGRVSGAAGLLAGVYLWIVMVFLLP